MSNIEYLRQLHHKVEFEKDLILRRGEFYSYEKDLVFRFCVKDLIFIYYVHEKSLDFGRFIMPGNSNQPTSCCRAAATTRVGCCYD